MAGKQVTELDALPSFTDTSLLPVHNGAGLKKGTLTQLANYLGAKFSNPNLLINSDFKINQRGQSTYSSTGAGCTVDRWVGTNVKTDVNSDNTVTISSLSGIGYYTQHEENISYGKHTYSIYVQAITGTVKAFYKNKDSEDIELGTLKQGLNTFTSSDDGFKSFFLAIEGGSSVTLKCAKVEQGSIATKFVEPNKVEELAKCKRFTQYYDSIPCIPGILFVANTTGATSGWLPLYQILSPSMRVVPTISVFSVNANNGNSIGGNYSVNLDNNRLKSVVFKEANTYHTIILNKVLLDAEIY